MSKNLIRTVTIYTISAYATTWLIISVLYLLIRNDLLSEGGLNKFHSIASIGPFFAAFYSAYIFYGKGGVKQLIHHIIRFPKLRIELLLLTISPLIFFGVGLLIYALFKSEWFDFKVSLIIIGSLLILS